MPNKDFNGDNSSSKLKFTFYSLKEIKITPWENRPISLIRIHLHLK